jgi:pimeloyl-ACP methyl ester carboxylesterase
MATVMTMAVSLFMAIAIIMVIAKATRSISSRIRQVVCARNGRVEAPSDRIGRRRETVGKLQGNAVKSFKIRTVDGVHLDGVWCTNSEGMANGNAVIIFHGNGDVLDSRAAFAAWYVGHGFAVLMVTMRGYPGSEGDSARDGEAGMYRDMSAAVDYVVGEGFQHRNIIAHGYSLGGSLAAAAASFYGLGGLTLDHTFTSIGEVATIMLKKLPSSIVRLALKAAYPSGHRIDLGNGSYAMSDGLDTLAKVRTFKGALFVIYGTGDQLMPVEFATKFLEARYSEGRLEKPLAFADINGDHERPHFHEDDQDLAQQRYLAHLRHRFLN